jgi:hypothetical protein
VIVDEGLKAPKKQSGKAMVAFESYFYIYTKKNKNMSIIRRIIIPPSKINESKTHLNMLYSYFV